MIVKITLGAETHEEVAEVLERLLRRVKEDGLTIGDKFSVTTSDGQRLGWIEVTCSRD
jgi:hypothetical protein